MTSIKLFAGTNIGLRDNNEDNFTVCKDLTQNEWIVPDAEHQAIPLGSRGCIMVVADGMGGQNAGEVASDIAVKTVQEMFNANTTPADVFKTQDAIKNYLKKVIVEADMRVKSYATKNPEAEGMGSTIVMAWLIGSAVYVAWLGDSRAYSFIPKKGIGRLSKDHSYVQQMVDAGALTDEEAMNHPNSNIITRSLGDYSQKAKPEVVMYPIEDGEVLLLCSDGLCGVVRDEEIGGIIEANIDNLQLAKEKLITAALAAGGSDNITVALMQINKDASQNVAEDNIPKNKPIWKKIAVGAIATLVLGGLAYAGYYYTQKSEPTEPKKDKKAELTINLTLDKESLAKGETATYTVEISDPAENYSLEVDETLLKVDAKKNRISISPVAAFSKDSITFLTAVCKSDTTKSSKIPLTLVSQQPQQIQQPQQQNQQPQQQPQQETQTDDEPQVSDGADDKTEKVEEIIEKSSQPEVHKALKKEYYVPVGSSPTRIQPEE